MNVEHKEICSAFEDLPNAWCQLSKFAEISGTNNSLNNRCITITIKNCIYIKNTKWYIQIFFFHWDAFCLLLNVSCSKRAWSWKLNTADYANKMSLKLDVPELKTKYSWSLKIYLFEIWKYMSLKFETICLWSKKQDIVEELKKKKHW